MDRKHKMPGKAGMCFISLQQLLEI